MLTIHGRTYTQLNDSNLALKLGAHYRWTTTFHNYIHNLIYNRNINPPPDFPCMDDMIQDYLALVSPNFALQPLFVQPGWLYYPPGQNLIRPMPAVIEIRMTGSRDRDENIANSKLRRTFQLPLSMTLPPPNYTWHHAEGIYYHDRNFFCKMCLVDTAQHRARHCGGVNEYKWIYATGYRPE